MILGLNFQGMVDGKVLDPQEDMTIAELIASLSNEAELSQYCVATEEMLLKLDQFELSEDFCDPIVGEE